MSFQSGIKVTARLAHVGINGLDAKTGTQPAGDGISSYMIGTNSQYPTSTYIPTAMLHRNRGRLATCLKNLWNGGAINIEIDGRVITSISELMAYGEPAGYVRRGSAFLTPHTHFVSVSGVWTDTYDDTNHRRYQRRTAGAAVEKFLVELPPEMLTRNGEGGVKLRSLEMVYGITVAAVADVTLVVYKNSKPTTGSQMAAGAALHTSGAYDTAHDTAAERKTATYHTMEFTFSQTVVDWLVDGESVFVEVTVDSTAIATAVFDYYGMNVNYFERAGIASNSDQS